MIFSAALFSKKSYRPEDRRSSFSSQSAEVQHALSACKYNAKGFLSATTGGNFLVRPFQIKKLMDGEAEKKVTSGNEILGP